MKKLLLSLLGVLIALPSVARDFEYTYKGQTITYTVIDEDTKTCMTKEGYPKAAWYISGNDVSGSLVLPTNPKDGDVEYTLTAIGDGAFPRCSGLTSVEIPNSVTSIGESAFSRCSGLTGELIIPNAVNSIGGSAFYGCSALTSVTIGNSVETIGSSAFEGCSGLTSVTIGNSVQTIGESAFCDCKGLTSVTIGNSVQTIGEYAFCDCKGLTSVIIPESVQTIGESAFSRCSGLTSVIIPNSVETIGTSAFNGCSGLTSVIIGNSVTSIGDTAFYYCKGLTSVIIGNSVASIGWGAFRGCSGLTSVVIPNSVTSIGNYAFEGCSGLIKSAYPNTINNPFSNGICISYPAEGAMIEDGFVYGPDKSAIYFAPLSLEGDFTIPSSVQTIGTSAFSRCSGLTSVIIPNSVISIGSWAFSGCSGLIKSAYPNTINNPFSNGICISYPAEGAMIEDWVIYNSDKSTIYFAPLSLEGEFTIPTSVTSIGERAFWRCTGLTSVEIPNSVTSIGANAFRDCSGLTSVIIPNSVETIGTSAFNGCSGLTSAEIPNSVNSIGNYAFYGCSGLTSLTVADGETSLALGEDAFKDAPIETLYLGRNWTGAISTGVKTVELGSMVNIISDKAFAGYKDLSLVKVPWEKPLAISANVFSNDTYANATLDIPDNTILDYMAQTDTWGKFSDMSVDGAATKIFSDNVFKYRLIDNDTPDAVLIPGDYSSMTEANIPERFTDDSDPDNPVRYYVTAIGPNAFKNCTNLSAVNINSRSKLTTIGAAAFSGCTGLTSFTMPAELTDINANAFENCTGMTDVKLNDKLTTLGRSAFASCTGLTSFTMSKDMTEIGPQAFYGCNNITAFNLNDKLTTICDSAFFDCKALPEISIPASVREIRGSAFGGCTQLTKAEFASIKDLCLIDFVGNNWANPLNFAHHLYINGEEVTEVVVPDGIEKLKITFVGCSDITSVTLPNTLKEIASLTFYGCYGLSSIEIPNSVTAISGNRAFYNCYNLTSVKLGQNIETISKRAFEKCESLTSISIPASVTYIGDEAFASTGLKSLTLLDGDEPLEFGSSVFSGALIEDLYFGRLTNTDVFKSKWSLKTVNVANTLTEIYPATFKGCSYLETLRLGSALTTIGDEAFSGCSALTEVIVPPSVETIGESAFANNSKLESIIMGHSVKTIGAKAYDGCPAKTVSITAQVPPTAPNTTFSTYTGKLWLQDPGDESVMNAYYDAFTCWDRFDSYAMVTPAKIEGETQDIKGKPGETFQLTAQVWPENVTLPQVFWRSTNPDIATVDENGLVTIHADISEIISRAGGDEEVRSCKIIAETLYADGPVLEVTVYDETAGIDDIVTDNSVADRGEIDYTAPYDVYNLNGVKVAADTLEGLNHGFYIVRQGRVAKKIAIN